MAKSTGTFRPFTASSPSCEVIGASLVALVDGMMIPGVAMEILAREGIDQVDPTRWYSQQKKLNLLKTISDALGNDTLYSIGYRIPYNAVFPEHVRDVPTALHGIDEAYHLSTRGGDVGFYRCTEPERGSYEIWCVNPYPCDFDMGIIASLVDRFRGGQSYRLVHVPGACRKDGGPHCKYRVMRLEK